MSKKILIIGNSDGIGAAVTKKLLDRGECIVGISRSPSPLGDQGPRHEVMDVASPDYSPLLQRLLTVEGPFDTCIYCAAIGSGLELPDLSREANVLEVNFTAMVRTLEVLVPDWLKRKQGHFIGLSSIADDFYNIHSPSYTASKAGFSNYLLAMALKLRSHGVYVTNIRFGFVDTKLAKASVKPMMMSTDRAADYVLRCLEKRPIQLTVPKLAGAFIRALRWKQSLQIWTS